jgi:DNA polymerase-3 subunit gamma/tau
MEKIALYRKYRPHNFDNLVGQDYIKTTLANAIKANSISHAYLFSGPRGTGKTSCARLLAKALNCTDLKENYDPCNECEFCVDINEGKLIDLIEIDAASNRGIDEVRDLKEKINFAPTRAMYKIYIIDEVHMMTKEAFNALLKTLEEPPAHVYFILATTEIHKIPETIISRCQRFDFKRISRKALMTRLSYIAQLEKIKAEDKAFETISKYVDGGLRDAIGLLEQLTVDSKLDYEHVQEVLGVSDISLLEGLFEALNSKNTKEALKIIHELHDQGSDLKKFIHEFVENLRGKLLESVANDEKGKIAKFMMMIEVFQDAQKQLYMVDIPQLPLEMAVIKIAGPARDVESVEEEQGTVQKEKRPLQKEEVKAEKKESPKREHKSISPDITLDLKSLKENWPRITERIKSPSLRLSLKTSIPVELEGKNLTLQFDTNFHKNKVMEHDHRVELEAVIKDLIGQGIKILSVVKEIEIKSVVDEESSGPAEAPEQNEDSSKELVDEALDVFGGEVVE